VVTFYRYTVFVYVESAEPYKTGHDYITEQRFS
jgi:hypothetical protein